MSDRRKQIKLLSRANEERKFIYCLFVVYPRICGINYGFLCIYNKKTGEQFRSPVFKINLVLQFLQPVLHVHPDAVLRLDGTYPMF
jgi:hypothetical protein